MNEDYILGYLIGLGTILLTAKPLVRGLEYESNKIAPNQVLDAGAALEWWRRGNLTGDQLQSELASQGLDASRIAVLQILQETLLAAGDAVAGLYRGTMSQADFQTAMQKLGFSAKSIATMVSNFETRLAAGDLFAAEKRKIAIPSSVGDSEKELYVEGLTPDRVAMLRSLSFRVPELTDLFSFAAWNVEDASAVSAAGLDQGKPADYYDRALAAGYDQATADLMWNAHWTEPPVFILHTLFQTGQLSEDDLAYFLKVAQHPPGFIPKIVQAFYKQISESQIVDFLQNNIIQESDVDGLLKNNGYSPVSVPLIHASLMIKASLPSSEEKAAAAAQKAQFKSLSVGAIMTSYEDGLIGADEATTLMTDLQIAQDVITFHLQTADFKVKKAAVNDEITNIGNQFILGTIQEADAIGQLNALGVSATKQSNLIIKWTKALPKPPKLPTKAELTVFLKNGLIDIPTYQTRMVSLGYSESDITLFIATLNKSSLAATELLIAQSEFNAPIP
jgi:hypothetical protein